MITISGGKVIKTRKYQLGPNANQLVEKSKDFLLKNDVNETSIQAFWKKNNPLLKKVVKELGGSLIKARKTYSAIRESLPKTIDHENKIVFILEGFKKAQNMLFPKVKNYISRSFKIKNLQDLSKQKSEVHIDYNLMKDLHDSQKLPRIPYSDEKFNS